MKPAPKKSETRCFGVTDIRRQAHHLIFPRSNASLFLGLVNHG